MLRRTEMPRPTKPLARHTPLKAVTALVSRTRLRQVSAKRATAMWEAGKPVTTRIPKQRDTGPTRRTVELVMLRDEARCGWCGEPICGERGWDWSVSHRRPRRAGGDPRPDTNSAANLVLVHGHALSLCHLEIENGKRREAKRRGHVLSARAVPAETPIDHAVHGWVLLDDQGDWRAVAA